MAIFNGTACGPIKWQQLPSTRLIKSVLWNLSLPKYLSKGDNRKYLLWTPLGKRFEGIFPSHCVNQQSDLSDHCSLEDYFRFNIWVRLLRHHAVLRLIRRIDYNIFRIILVSDSGGTYPTIKCHLIYPCKIGWDISSHLIMSNWVRYFHPIYPCKIGWDNFIPSNHVKSGEIF